MTHFFSDRSPRQNLLLLSSKLLISLEKILKFFQTRRLSRESDCDLEFLKKSEMEKKMNLMGGIIEMGHP